MFLKNTLGIHIIYTIWLSINRNWFAVCIFLFCFLPGKTQAQVGKTETGTASYYHDKFIGRKTSNGERFDQTKYTAAHKSLPLGTWVKVTNLKNDSTVIVKINDRMPQSNKRCIDLSKAAAKKLNYLNSGLTKVKIEVIPDPQLKSTIVVNQQRATLPDKNISPCVIPQFNITQKEILLKYPKLRPDVINTEKKHFLWFN